MRIGSSTCAQEYRDGLPWRADDHGDDRDREPGKEGLPGAAGGGEQSAGTLTIRATTGQAERIQCDTARIAGRTKPGAAEYPADSAGAQQLAQHGCAAAAADHGIQRLCGRAVDSESEPGAGAADYLVGSGSSRATRSRFSEFCWRRGRFRARCFQNGIALFGGGLTLSGVSPDPSTVNLN